MRNPIAELLESRKAQKALNDAGLQGGILEAANAAIAFLVDQHEELESLRQTLEDSKLSDDVAVNYYVTYEFDFTEFHNGGRRSTHKGNASINVNGGITSFQTVAAVAKFIRETFIDKSFPNVRVLVTGFTELNRCKIKQPEQNPGENQETPPSLSDQK